MRVGGGNLPGMSEPSLTSITIYQLRVVLCGVSPLVWRRWAAIRIRVKNTQIDDSALRDGTHVTQITLVWVIERLLDSRADAKTEFFGRF